jgi:hypothetical protein
MIEVLTEEQVEPVQHHSVSASIGQDFLNACIGLNAKFELHSFGDRRTVSVTVAVTSFGD